MEVFPAYAGMIPSQANAFSLAQSVPRIRGDDPPTSFQPVATN